MNIDIRIVVYSTLSPRKRKGSKMWNGYYFLSEKMLLNYIYESVDNIEGIRLSDARNVCSFIYHFSKRNSILCFYHDLLKTRLKLQYREQEFVCLYQT